MIKINLQNNKGFVLLFAVTFSSIVLSIALGITNIAFKEVKFGTNARDTNNAFFAADTGIESVLFQDKDPNTTPFPMPDGGDLKQFPIIIIPNLSGANGSCAIVSVTKDNRDSSKPITTIISKGYNVGNASCSPINSDRIEREIKVSY